MSDGGGPPRNQLTTITQMTLGGPESESGVSALVLLRASGAGVNWVQTVPSHECHDKWILWAMTVGGGWQRRTLQLPCTFPGKSSFLDGGSVRTRQTSNEVKLGNFEFISTKKENNKQTFIFKSQSESISPSPPWPFSPFRFSFHKSAVPLEVIRSPYLNQTGHILPSLLSLPGFYANSSNLTWFLFLEVKGRNIWSNSYWLISPFNLSV